MLRIITKANNNYRKGTWFDCGDDGLCQIVEPQTRNGQVVSYNYKGLMIPNMMVIPFSVGVGKRGLEVAGSRRM